MIAAVSAQHLPGVLHSLEPTLNHYGYLAIDRMHSGLVVATSDETANVFTVLLAVATIAPHVAVPPGPDGRG